jgi:hypothetical protein
MTPNLSPRALLISSISLLLGGFLLPLLMALQAVQSTLFLNFCAYILLVFGNLLGLVGIVSLFERNRNR